MSYWIVYIWQFTFNIDCFGSFESYSVLLFAHWLSKLQLNITIIHFVNYSVNWKSCASLQIFPTTLYNIIWGMYTFFFKYLYFYWCLIKHIYNIHFQVFSYFTVCLWMVPFIFILSLSANDNTLPITNVGKLNTFTNSKYLFIAIHITFSH